MDKRLIDAYRLLRMFCTDCGMSELSLSNKCEESCAVFDTIMSAPTVDTIKEEDILKFYYCESEDDYYIGQRVGNFYYARYDANSQAFVWQMSRYLPWGEHVADKNTLWKEHTYPSEPVEIDFSDWLKGFLKKYYGASMFLVNRGNNKETV